MTPGPWQAATDGAEVYGADVAEVCYVNGPRNKSELRSAKEAKANARAIAAVPELIAALENMVEAAEWFGGRVDTPPGIAAWIEDARAALAKAKGGGGA